MKSKIILNHFGKKLVVPSFNEKTFFNNFLGFAPYWDQKLYHTYTGEKVLKLNTPDKIVLKSDVYDGSVVNVSGQHISYCFVSKKSPG